MDRHITSPLCIHFMHSRPITRGKNATRNTWGDTSYPGKWNDKSFPAYIGQETGSTWTPLWSGEEGEGPWDTRWPLHWASNPKLWPLHDKRPSNKARYRILNYAKMESTNLKVNASPCLSSCCLFCHTVFSDRKLPTFRRNGEFMCSPNTEVFYYDTAETPTFRKHSPRR